MSLTSSRLEITSATWGNCLGTSATEVNASRQQLPRWAQRKAKTLAGVFTAFGAALSGITGVAGIGNFLNDLFLIGWFSSAARAVGVGLTAIGAIWLLATNHKEKDEIEVLRTRLEEAEGLGVGHAASEFRLAVKSIVAFNESGWTPENVKRFQQDALQFGKSLFDYLGVPEARVCLYAPGAEDTEPEFTNTSTNITALTWVWSTPVPGRHDPRETIGRSKETNHMFQALKSRQPQHTKKRRRAKVSSNHSKKWKSAICMGVRTGNEPIALLTVDSTGERAFDNIAEGVLALLGDLLSFAEGEKDRERVALITQPKVATLQSGNRR